MSAMSNKLPVARYREVDALPGTLLEEMRGIVNSIQEQAFRLFQGRGSQHGWDLDDWLQAERETVCLPDSELVENERDFRARMALPGFAEKDLKVTATPEALIVEAEQRHTHAGEEGNVRLCEFSGKKLFRRLDLPSAINVEQVSATLDKGILQINAPKASQPKQIRVAAA
jgi:HSP20 family protein